MKREADGDMMGSPQKRSRRGDEEVRLLIPSKAAGSIIGKGGQNITKLRSQYKASITVPDCPGPERMLTLSSDVPTICKIITDVIPNLEQNGAKQEDDLDLRMMIHQSQAGCVIGKAGAKIKELRTSTGARIKIFSICAPQSTDRIIQINGQDFQCINAIQEIIKLTKTTPIKGIVNQYNPHNYDEFYADEYGGFGCGGGGNGSGVQGDMRRGAGGGPSRGGRGGGPRNGDRFNNRPPPPRGGPPPMGNNFNDRGPMGPGPGPMHNRGSFGGPPPPPRGMNGGGGGMNGGPPPFERNNGWSNGPPPPPINGAGNGNMMNQMPPNMMQGGGMGNNNQQQSMGGNGGGPGGMPQGGNNGSNGGSKTSTQVTIPKDLAGAIIGKGGSRIRKIRQDSGAGITIDEPLPGSNDRIITITGNPNQIQMAQYLLQQSLSIERSPLKPREHFHQSGINKSFKQFDSVHNNTDQRNGY
ncbi:heterogeneous nuclear ribonucleoprotein K-like isoform X2 [Atheta coriaria]